MNGRPVIDQLLQDRLRGIAVGAAIGDALGMPLEFGPKRPTDQLVTEMTTGRLPAGSFTDDTEMALALAFSLMETRPLDPDYLVERFVAWMKTNPPDIGLHTGAVLTRVGNGIPWVEAVEFVHRERPNSAGNGSLMRCWPVAIAYWNNLDNLLIDSWEQSRVTHAHRDCLTACAFTNVLIYNLLQGMPPDVAITVTSTMVRTSEEFWRRVYNAAYIDREDLKNSGWVMDTLESAIWGLVNTQSFEEAVVQVVNLGNDADTAGAVVGALAGARYGYSAIPERWTSKLEGTWPVGNDQPWDTKDFIRLADQLSTGITV